MSAGLWNSDLTPAQSAQVNALIPELAKKLGRPPRRLELLEAVKARGLAMSIPAASSRICAWKRREGWRKPDRRGNARPAKRGGVVLEGSAASKFLGAVGSRSSTANLALSKEQDLIIRLVSYCLLVGTSEVRKLLDRLEQGAAAGKIYIDPNLERWK